MYQYSHTELLRPDLMTLISTSQVHFVQMSLIVTMDSFHSKAFHNSQVVVKKISNEGWLKSWMQQDSNSQNDIPVLYQDGKETELACQTRWANSHCQTTWSTPPTWICLRNTWIKQICLGRQYIFSQAFHKNILTFGCTWADQTVFQILLLSWPEEEEEEARSWHCWVLENGKRLLLWTPLALNQSISEYPSALYHSKVYISSL